MIENTETQIMLQKIIQKSKEKLPREFRSRASGIIQRLQSEHLVRVHPTILQANRNASRVVLIASLN